MPPVFPLSALKSQCSGYRAVLRTAGCFRLKAGLHDSQVSGDPVQGSTEAVQVVRQSARTRLSIEQTGRPLAAVDLPLNLFHKGLKLIQR